MAYEDILFRKKMSITSRVNKKYNIEQSMFFFMRSSFDADQADFKKLLNADDPACKIVAWNAISIDEMPHRKGFSEEEYEFIRQRLEADNTAINCSRTNPNKDIVTDRLILKSPCDAFPDFSHNRDARSSFDGDKCEPLRLYRKHLKEDGDFKLYAGLKPTNNNIKRLELLLPLCFAVYEKGSGDMVGIVGLYFRDDSGRSLPYDEERRIAYAQWYIFKPYRNKGYCKEAVTALIKQAFAHKLFVWREQLMDCTYKKHYANIDLIRVQIRASNKTSQATARACGFVEKYVDRRHFIVEGEGLEDSVVFEFEPGDLKA